MVESSRQRGIPQPQALHYSYEKAGLVLDGQPVPWNAEAVVVEARVSLPHFYPTLKYEFSLRLAGIPQVFSPESLVPEENAPVGRLFFRLPVPSRTTSLELFWRDRSRGQMTLPILQAEEFFQHLALSLSGLSVRLGDQTVVCQTCVASQVKDVITSAVLGNTTSLAPLVDLGVKARIEDGNDIRDLPVHFSNSQLRSRQALITIVLPRPRKSGHRLVHWLIGDRTIASHRLQCITKPQFLRSLRLSSTRFILQNEQGGFQLVRWLSPGADFERAGPCFLVSSNLPGMAGLAEVQVFLHKKEGSAIPFGPPQTMLVSDGPSPLAVGTLSAKDLKEVRHFELRAHGKTLGMVPLEPAPAAKFTSEGGFHEEQGFLWTPTAEELLREKLGRLMN